MDAQHLRRLVARLEGAAEGAHHGHPDFRVEGRIFATLNEPEDRSALRLTAHEARALSAHDPVTFRLVSVREPVAWVSVLLERIDAQALADLLEEAWRLRLTSARPTGRRASPGRRPRQRSG